MTIYQRILAAKLQGKKSIAVLIDPDEAKIQRLDQLLGVLDRTSVDYIFIGGSLVYQDVLDACVHKVRQATSIPVILFPGSPQQIHSGADAILFLSLISGRNPEYLIGAHVQAAPALKASGLEVIPTGYMLIDGGHIPTTAYITQTIPIPADKPEIAVCTALAGEMLGMKMIYLEAGSGAIQPVRAEMIRQVSRAVQIPVIAGGGIRDFGAAKKAFDAGADIVVIGTALEDNADWLKHFTIQK